MQCIECRLPVIQAEAGSVLLPALPPLLAIAVARVDLDERNDAVLVVLGDFAVPLLRLAQLQKTGRALQRFALEGDGLGPCLGEHFGLVGARVAELLLHFRVGLGDRRLLLGFALGLHGTLAGLDLAVDGVVEVLREVEVGDGDHVDGDGALQSLLGERRVDHLDQFGRHLALDLLALLDHPNPKPQTPNPKPQTPNSSLTILSFVKVQL
jgi:hypothetical protein